jgi:hypothetical protein
MPRVKGMDADIDYCTDHNLLSAPFMEVLISGSATLVHETYELWKNRYFDVPLYEWSGTSEGFEFRAILTLDTAQTSPQYPELHWFTYTGGESLDLEEPVAEHEITLPRNMRWAFRRLCETRRWDIVVKQVDSTTLLLYVRLMQEPIRKPTRFMEGVATSLSGFFREYLNSPVEFSAAETREGTEDFEWEFTGQAPDLNGHLTGYAFIHYADAELTELQEEEIRLHLSACIPCQLELARIRQMSEKVTDALDQLTDQGKVEQGYGMVWLPGMKGPSIIHQIICWLRTAKHRFSHRNRQ